MRSLYQIGFKKAVGCWLLPYMKRTQGLKFPSASLEARYDQKISHLFFLLLVAIVVLIVAKSVLVIAVAIIVIYASYLTWWLYRHRITTRKQRLRQKKQESR